MNVRTANPSDCSKISNYIGETGSSSLYHDYRWGEVIEKTFGNKCYYLLCERDDGSVVGVLPLVHLKSFMFGNHLVSMPYFNYGGVSADNETNRDQLIEQAIDLLKDLKGSHMELRQEDPLNNGFPSKTSKVSMRLNLPGAPDELWKAFSSKLRSQIKRPIKEGMVARFGKHEELDNFYKVFSVCMRNLGTPVYHKQFFRNILEHFPRNTWICSVYHQGMPVASGFLAGFKDRLEIPWAATIKQYNRLSPNMLLYWASLEFACREGFAVFDFGRSTRGEGTYKFKEQWGAVPLQLNWHYWVKNNGSIPDITSGNPKYKLAIELWKRLPVPVTRILGPPIVKNIP
jgi:FemAB-related protein (PEP-CTERM system-associated)